MRLIFVRHGEKDRNQPGEPLTPHGVAMAEEAGRWLRDRGHRPAVVAHTARRRTRETAEALARAFQPAPPLRLRSGSVSTGGQWDRLAAELGDGAAFVGHHGTQDLLSRAPGAPRLPEGHRAGIFVMERDASGAWRCVDHWPGVPQRRS